MNDLKLKYGDLMKFLTKEEYNGWRKKPVMEKKLQNVVLNLEDF